MSVIKKNGVPVGNRATTKHVDNIKAKCVAGCKLKVTGYANVWIELLEASSPKWNDRYDRYKNSGIEKEDMNALNHEMDHFNTWKAFYSFVKSLNSYDGKVFPGDCDLRANNTNAFDLSNANFEFPNNNPAQGNVDNPAVPNVDVVFTTYNFNMIFLNNSGVEAYVLARFPEGEDRTTFIANYKYDYSFTNATGKVTSKSVYKIPNTWIVDGVNTASPDKLLHLLTSSSIDGGSTGVGSSYQNTDRYGKSIRRVVIGQSVDGKNVYKDTNDSSVDFIKNAEPSLKNGIVH